MGTTKVRIFWKRIYLVSLNFSLTKETETKKREQWCKDSIIDLVNRLNHQCFPNCLVTNVFFCKIYYSRIEILKKLLAFFVSVSRDRKIWGNERIYFLENPDPKSFLSLIYIFSWLFGEKRRRHYLRMIIINQDT